MKSIKLYFLFVAIFIQLNSNAQNFKWASKISGDVDDNGNDITSDKYGNVYTVGFFNGSRVDFDPGVGEYKLSSRGDDVFICKFDSLGKFIWAKTLLGSSQDNAHSLVLDDTGNVYITGSFSNAIDFDPGPQQHILFSYDGTSTFILKLNTDGDFKWAKNIKTNQSFGNNVVTGKSITIDKNGDICIVGAFKGTIDFNPDAPTFVHSASSTDAFVLKLTNGGDFIWAKRIGALDLDFAYKVTVDVDGNYYIVGKQESKIHIFKLSPLGDIIWSKIMGGIKPCEGRSIALSESGSIYITGFFQDTVDFDPSNSEFKQVSKSLMQSSVFILKLDTSGNFKWVKSIGNNYNASGYTIATFKNGDVILAGIYRGTLDLNPGIDSFMLSTSNSQDNNMFVLLLDSKGNFKWAFQIGGNFYDIPNAISVDFNNNILLTGGFSGICDFNPGSKVFNLKEEQLTTNDIFILKLGNCNINIVKQPISQSKSVGDSAIFYISTNINSVNKQWQKDMGSGFVNLINSNKYMGVSSDTLLINVLLLSENNHKFRCIVSEGACSDTSDVVTLNFINSNIKQIRYVSKLELYPNPLTNNNLFIENLEIGEHIITITDLAGKLYNQKNIEVVDSQKVLLNTNLPNGIYIIKVQNINSIKICKLIVQDSK